MSKKQLDTKNFKSVEIDLSEKDFIKIATKAHEKDITFNAMCNIILEDAISMLEQELKEKKKNE